MAHRDDIRARAGIPFGGELPPRVFMVMPGGTHEIVASKGEEPIRIVVRVDRETASVLQRTLLANQGKRRPFFDFDHQEQAAAAWPEEFFWSEQPEPGVYCRAEWSEAGAEAVRGKTYRSFSPAFRVDRYVTDAQHPARISGAPLVMGGLVNDPAFAEMAPLWARNAPTAGVLAHGHGAARGEGTEGFAGAAGHNTKGTNIMNEQELAALKAKLAQIESELGTLRAKSAAGDEAAVQARNAEIRIKESEAELARVKIAGAEQAKQVINLQAEIKARNERMADDAIKAAVARGAIAPKDEAVQARYRKLISEDPANVVLVESLPASAALGAAITAGRVECVSEEPSTVIRAYAAELSPLKRGVIYAANLRKLMSHEEGCEHVIRAANTLGTVAGGLVVQRALDLLKLAFPVLSRISTNFSGENAAYGEAVTTRLVTPPAVGTYHVDNGYVSQAAVSADVAVTIDAHRFCQVEFNANELAGTRRLLFGENEEGMHYSLGKDLIDAIYALFTAANYTETATVEALVDFDRSSIIQLGVDMNTTSAGRNANTGTRTALLSSAYHGKLAEDVVIVGGLNNPGAGSTIATGVLPMVHGFLPVEAPNLPTTANLVGVGLRADAVALAVRPANDYTTAQPGLPATGNVQQVTNPDTGVTVTMVQFVDHKLGKSYMRIAWMRGVAVGNPKAGQLIKSAA